MDILTELVSNGEIIPCSGYEVTTAIINCRYCNQVLAYPVVLGNYGEVIGVVIRTLNYDSYMLSGSQSLTCKYCQSLQCVTSLIPKPTLPTAPLFTVLSYISNNDEINRT